MRLEGKIAVVVGAGQSPGEGIGNGRATVLRFAREGAKVLAVDRDLASAEETAAMVTAEGGTVRAVRGRCHGREPAWRRPSLRRTSAGGGWTSSTTTSA